MSPRRRRPDDPVGDPAGPAEAAEREWRAAVGALYEMTRFDHPRGPTDFNARRYRWVKKRMDRFDVCPGADETVVYSIGTLYGEWIDGTPFEGNRYVDRFVVRGGQIVKMDVWNDSAERILVQRGIEA